VVELWGPASCWGFGVKNEGGLHCYRPRLQDPIRQATARRERITQENSAMWCCTADTQFFRQTVQANCSGER
jgi:hypothetical protein